MYACVLKPVLLENAGEECLIGCNQQPGKCGWCGPEGFCCKKGLQEYRCDGSFGGETRHECVLKPEGNSVGQFKDSFLIC